MLTTKMASPTYSGVVAINERTLYPFTCFTCTVNYDTIHMNASLDNVYCSAKIKIA